MTDTSVQVLDRSEHKEQPDEAQNILLDLKYICKSTSLITDSLQKGFDVAQLPNGDIIVTEVQTLNIQYAWDASKQKMIRISQS
jgi:hypothetical protein